jgi:hypothetical protein
MTNTNTEQWGNIELPGLSDEKLFKTNWHLVGVNKEKSNDPEWRKKVATAVKKQFKDKEWLKNRSEKTREFWKTKEALEMKSKLQKAAWADPVKREKMTKALTVRYDDGKLAKKISLSLKNSDACKKNGKRNRKPVKTPDGVFASRKEAATFYKVDPTQITKKISYKEGWEYISQEEYILLTGKEP